MSEVKDRLPLLISIVISPVVDKLQEYGKEQWNKSLGRPGYEANLHVHTCLCIIYTFVYMYMQTHNNMQ